jgi:hypothetical protein
MASGTVTPSSRYIPTGPRRRIAASQNHAPVTRPRERAVPTSIRNTTASMSVTKTAQPAVYVGNPKAQASTRGTRASCG